MPVQNVLLGGLGPRVLLDWASDLLTLHDRSGRVLYASAASERVLGLAPEELIGTAPWPLVHPDDLPRLVQQLRALRARSGEVHRFSVRARHQDGSYHQLESLARNGLDDPALGCVLLSTRDVSERVQARERLRGLAFFQSAVLDSLPALTAVVDRDGIVLAVNAAWRAHVLAGGGRPERCGTGVDYFAVCAAAKDLPQAQEASAGLRAVLGGRSSTHSADVPCLTLDGTVRYFALTMVPLHASSGGAVISYLDITARKELEVAAAHRATHDVLTGLANRTLLLERLEHALAARRPTGVAVLFLDLDHFKLVNDGYGHEAGDAVLRSLAERMRRHVRPSDTVARLAGDEFVVLCEDLSPASEARVLAERLIAEVAEPFIVGDGHQVQVGVSIGVAIAGDPPPGPADLLRSADQAMLDAKSRGRNCVVVYDADVHGSHHLRFEQAMALRRLLEDRRLLVHYQPVVDLRTGALTGAEALLRWRGEDLLPDTATAIALAEEMGLIGGIGRFVLKEATRQASSFLLPDGSVLPLAVNLAPQQLEHRLVAQVEEAAGRAGYPLSSLTLELTERSVLGHLAVAVDVLGALRHQGVRVALDDFGVGYSSLAHLRDLPLDVLKVDQGFVRSLAGPDPDLRILRAIIEMARALGVDVIAEGVEREDQRAWLVELGCLRGQGFLFSRARSARALRALAR